MSEYDFRVTNAFVDSYETLEDETAAAVDEAVLCLLRNHSTAWARQGRVSGEDGGAWIIEIHTGAFSSWLYWDYLGDECVLLMLLIVDSA